MATFYGGDHLFTVTSLTRNTNGSDSYTIPSGKYAEVSFFLNANDTGDQVTLVVGGASFFASQSGNQGKLTGFVVATAGQTITLVVNDSGDSDSSGHVGIRVYNNP